MSNLIAKMYDYLKGRVENCESMDLSATYIRRTPD
jgi:hypothetical protein